MKPEGPPHEEPEFDLKGLNLKQLKALSATLASQRDHIRATLAALHSEASMNLKHIVASSEGGQAKLNPEMQGLFDEAAPALEKIDHQISQLNEAIKLQEQAGEGGLFKNNKNTIQ